MNKRLIINADDFGLISGVNYGILHAYLNQSILMINVPKTKEAVEIMKRYHFDCVGIHIHITLGKPISDPSSIPSLIEDDGTFHQSKWWFENKANEDDLKNILDVSQIILIIIIVLIFINIILNWQNIFFKLINCQCD